MIFQFQIEKKFHLYNFLLIFFELLKKIYNVKKINVKINFFER